MAIKNPPHLTKALERVYELTGTYHVPDHCYETILCHKQFYPEYETINWQDISSTDLGLVEIELDRIISTAHPHYEKAGSWIEMLHLLEKYDKNKDIFQKGLDPALYDKRIFESIYLTEYKGKYKISTDGNNRVCIAKCMGFTTIFAHVSQIQIG